MTNQIANYSLQKLAQEIERLQLKNRLIRYFGVHQPIKSIKKPNPKNDSALHEIKSSQPNLMFLVLF